jgi:DNA-binding transcriptional ArsR family regulator
MNTCRPKLPLPDRTLMHGGDAERLGVLFKSLSQPTRLRMLHALIREGSLSVSDLAARVGMTVQAVSNQLQRLTEAGVVDCRREGVQIIYRVIDPCVPVLIERGWCHVEEYPGADEPVRAVEVADSRRESA